MGVDKPDGEVYGDWLFHYARDGELARLLALAAAFDPASYARLSALGVGPGWRCLDVGAGPGTLAGWLAEEVGEGGQVVAVDRDSGFLTDTGDLRVTIVEGDVTAAHFDPGRFDLVHARFLLMHLRDRDRVLPRLASWVRPGGWLVVSDSADLGTRSSPHESYRRTFTALWQALAETIGTDINYGRRYPAALAEYGLTDLGVAVDMPVVAAGTPISAFWRLTLEQSRPLVVATGLVDDHAIDQVLCYLQDPSMWDLSLAMITAWGRSPVPERRNRVSVRP